MKLREMKPDEFYSAFMNFCGGKVSRAEDLERIIGLAFNSGRPEVLDDLAFQAKYITGLTKIIQNKDNSFDEVYFARIKEEYIMSLEKVKEKIALVIEPGSDFIKEIFADKYFALTQESLGELNRLCEDLSRIKSYLNTLKEEGKGF